MKLLLVNPGWTPEAWLGELERKAKCCDEYHERTRVEYEGWADELRRAIASGASADELRQREYKAW